MGGWIRELWLESGIAPVDLGFSPRDPKTMVIDRLHNPTKAQLDLEMYSGISFGWYLKEGKTGIMLVKYSSLVYVVDMYLAVQAASS